MPLSVLVPGRGLIFIPIELQVTTIVSPFRLDDEDVDEPQEQAETYDTEDDPEPEQARRIIAIIIWLYIVFAYATVQAGSAEAARILGAFDPTTQVGLRVKRLRPLAAAVLAITSAARACITARCGALLISCASCAFAEILIFCTCRNIYAGVRA